LTVLAFIIVYLDPNGLASAATVVIAQGWLCCDREEDLSINKTTLNS
jgi:hypothetical protein